MTLITAKEVTYICGHHILVPTDIPDSAVIPCQKCIATRAIDFLEDIMAYLLTPGMEVPETLLLRAEEFLTNA